MKIFHLPDLGEGLAEAEIREWYVKEGDTVTVDQPLVSMETAKAVVDVPAPYAGKIAKLYGEVNHIIQTDAPLIGFLEEDNNEKPLVGKLEESAKKWDEDKVIIGATQKKSTTIKALPVARALAKQLNIDLSQVTPSGQQGQITAEDVKKFADHQHKSSSALGEHAEVLHGVRRSMAQTMAQSHREVVPATIMEDADVSKISLSDMTVLLLKGMAAAIKAEPSLNAWFDGNRLERRLFQEANSGLAVDTAEGLFVPVIKNVEALSTDELRQCIDNYKKSVSSRSISPKDMHGATITLSNFGTFTGKYASPVIVPPAVAILGCGRVREIAMPKGGQIVICRIAPLSLTFDHRAVTGGEATRFLAAVIQFLEGS